MVAFVTLFLGIAFGVHSVELSAGAEVARIELYIDGTRAVELGPPWTVKIDLGGEIAPHELVAVALDGAGRRLGEARQWVNRGTSAAEAAFVLERDGAGQPTAARLVWRCLESPEPTTISVSFDGRPLEVVTPERFPLPAHAPGTAHVLLADLTFPGGITATAIASFGGTRTDDALQELTAVPVRISRGARLPKVEQMVGWFEAGGQTLRVAAVEEGPAEVVFVLAGSVREEFQRLASEDFFPFPWPRPKPLELASRSRFHFKATVPQEILRSGTYTRLYPSSEEYTPAKGSFLQLGENVFLNELEGRPRIAEAVAVSGLSATRRERRRAVVLLLGPDARDESDFDAARARRYLSRVRVPLHVWRVSAEGTSAHADWPDALDASTIEGLGKAFGDLRADLASQRVVWVESRFPPSAVGVTPEARGIVTVR